MGLKLENQCPEISDEDIVQALNDDDLFDRKSERKKPGRTRNKSKNLRLTTLQKLRVVIPVPYYNMI